MAADSEISLLTRGSTPSKATRKTWSSYPVEEEEDGEEKVDQPSVKFVSPEGGIPSPELRRFEIHSTSVHKVDTENRPSEGAQTKLSLSFDTSQTPVRSTDTTLEFYDAPLSKEEDGDEGQLQKDEEVVTLNFKLPTEQEQAEENPFPTTEQPPLRTAEDAEEEEEANKQEMVEDAMEVFLKQGTESEEEVQSEELEKQDDEFGSMPEDAAALEQADPFSLSQGKLYFCVLSSSHRLFASYHSCMEQKRISCFLAIQNIT